MNPSHIHEGFTATSIKSFTCDFFYDSPPVYSLARWPPVHSAMPLSQTLLSPRPRAHQLLVTHQETDTGIA